MFWLRCRLQNQGTLDRSAVHKHFKLPFRDNELSETTIHANGKLWEDPNDRFIQTFESAEMNGNLAIKGVLVRGLAPLAGASFYRKHGKAPFETQRTALRF